MKTASIRDLRTQFPKVRRLLEHEGQIEVTDRGRPIALMRPYDVPARRRPAPFDYYRRLRRMPRRISDAGLREIDEADRAER
jgi:antitoxin (DNA-binding transcriptional repressor) of toxin-antitoxin stability system